MKKNPWLDRVKSFKMRLKTVDAKASDLDIVISSLMKIAPGQLKKVFTDEVVAILSKYGWDEES